ncbi:MAG: SpoIID/LytB domain-containing protein [Acidobacteriota bacterium]
MARAAARRFDLGEGWVVQDGGALVAPGLRVTLDDQPSFEVPGRWLAIEAPDAVGVRLDGGRYRGRVLLYLNDRGALNVINELPLEQYLRGVVPKEMGPSLYPAPAALRAQTVAARTYTLRNLGEFRHEGYDICATPRCQVYGGMQAEHSMTDAAIRATAGEVLLDAADDGAAQPAEVFYTATCGGHTADVSVVFPAKRASYLRGVPCIQSEVEITLGHDGDGSGATPDYGDDLIGPLMARLLPPPPGRDAQRFSARLEHLARLAGGRPGENQLVDLRTTSVRRILAAQLIDVLDPALAAALGPDGPAGDAPTGPLGDTLRRYGLIGPPPDHASADAPLDAAARDALLFAFADHLGVLRREPLLVHRRDAEALIVQRDSGTIDRMVLPDDLLTAAPPIAASADAPPVVLAPLRLLPGDRLTLYARGERPLALVQPKSLASVDLQRHSKRRQWRRTHSTDHLRRTVAARYPGFVFEGLQILSRGRSGRIGQLRLLGQGGDSVLITGLAIRWTLDVPETWFDVRQDGDRWHFVGRGWGHGVGLCQVGAFAMAQRGADHRQILRHYFVGARLGRMRVTSALDQRFAAADDDDGLADRPAAAPQPPLASGESPR